MDASARWVRAVAALGWVMVGGAAGACTGGTLVAGGIDGEAPMDATDVRDAGGHDARPDAPADGGAGAADASTAGGGDAGTEIPGTCGNELCGSGETCSTCELDCGACPPPSAHILFEETFEGAEVWPGLHQQFGTPHAFGVASSPVFEGERSGRFELRDVDPERSGGTRAEVLFPEQDDLDRWYAFSVYFPAEDYAADSHPEIINQWHQGGGTSPPIALEILDDRYRLVIPSLASGSGSTERIDLGPVVKDAWNRFVLHIRHSSAADGLIDIWLNGASLLSRAGPNTYDLASYAPPRWKVGIYKWRWNGDGTTDVARRVLYYDSIRLGDEGATLADM